MVNSKYGEVLQVGGVIHDQHLPARLLDGGLSNAYARLSGVQPTATTDGALVAGQHNPIDATSGNRTVTLADAASAGQLVVVSKKDSTANTVAVSVSHLRDGGAGTITLTGQYEALTLTSKADGSWWPIGDHKTKAFLDASFDARLSAVPDAGIGIGLTGQSVGTQNTTVQTTRITCLTTAQVSEASWCWTNIYYTGPPIVDTAGPGDLVIKAAIEINGTVFPLTFNGQRTVTIKAGALVWSDPFPLDLPAGSTYYVRTFFSSGTWATCTVQGPGMGAATITTDLTDAGAAAMTDGTTYTGIPGPSAARGRINASRSLLMMGDSLGYGQADGPSLSTGVPGTPALGQQGVGGRLAVREGIGMQTIATGSDRASSFAVAANRQYRMRQVGTATTVLCIMGRNDVSNGDSVSTIAGNMLTIAKLAAARRAGFLVATVTPRTSSTDGWVTTGSQTIVASLDTYRLPWNAWLRDGAPLVGGAYAATGTVGAVRCPVYDASGALVSAGSGTGHPFKAVLEFADCVESARNSGIWKAGTSGRSVADGAITTGTRTLTSATAAFTSADVGKVVTIAGAGAAGALYTGRIISVTNGTTVGLDAAAGTTVSAAAVWLGKSYTRDGLHPSTAGYDLMAAAVPSALIT